MNTFVAGDVSVAGNDTKGEQLILFPFEFVLFAWTTIQPCTFSFLHNVYLDYTVQTDLFKVMWGKVLAKFRAVCFTGRAARPFTLPKGMIIVPAPTVKSSLQPITAGGGTKSWLSGEKKKPWPGEWFHIDSSLQLSLTLSGCNEA